MAWKPVILPSDREVAEFTRAYKKKTRFLVDESLGKEVARVVTELGWNARYVADVGLGGHADGDIFAFAHRDDRVILTHDNDFLDDHRFPPHRNSGVVVLPGGDGNEQALTKSLSLMLYIGGHFRGLYRNAKMSISNDGTVTLRFRDHETGAMTNHRYRFARNGSLEEWVQ